MISALLYGRRLHFVAAPGHSKPLLVEFLRRGGAAKIVLLAGMPVTFPASFLRLFYQSHR